MGNRARRREEAERARRRRRAVAVAGAALAALAALTLGWGMIRGGPPDGAQAWELTDVRLDLVRPGDPGADAFAGHGYRVMFDARWEGETEEPPRRALPCSLTVRGADGSVVHETEFGLFVGGGETENSWNPTAIGDDEVEAEPRRARISCDQHGDGTYVITGEEVVRGWRVTYVPRWSGEGEPRVVACEVWLMRADDPEDAVLEQPLALSPRLDGETQELLAFADETSLPPEEAILECDPEEDDDDEVEG